MGAHRRRIRTVRSASPSIMPNGVIVEYFETSSAALMREQELEDLLIAAAGAC